MKTTLNLDDELYRQAKLKAVHEGRTVSQLVEEGLSLVVQSGGRKPPRRRPALPLIRGGHPAARGEELTPGKIAELLAAQEAAWAVEGE